MKNHQEKIIEKSILIVAFSTVFILFLITLFIFKEGLPFILNNGLTRLFFSTNWSPSDGSYGIIPMLIGSLSITFGALILGVPLGVACAIYLAEFSSKTLRNILKPMIELLAGIPSVVYGFIGMIFLAPVIRSYFGGPGLSILTASIVLGIMILPTIISISLDALLMLPRSYKEGSMALGATQWQTVTGVLLPAARSGILAGVILGMGRAIGETMAVIMVTGNSVKVPSSFIDSTRTLTANIALEMGYAIGEHRQALFATAIILFVFIIILNILDMKIIKKRRI